ncbi:MAG: hypothetical protein HW421_3101 [Ignavibacteria bacterium]|nr:hypothetical protein [Ignavibacteria bacterium]
MDVIIVAEDEVTRIVLKKILDYFPNKFNILNEMPVRGGKIKSLLMNFNKLSEHNTIIMLTDLDTYDCPPALLNSWFKNFRQNPNFIIRIAVDEAESWLMADREGFAEYFKVPLSIIPNSKILSPIKPHIIEMNFPYKSSLYLIREVIQSTGNKIIKEGIAAIDKTRKGHLYNSTMAPFITYHWNIDNAIKNSYSLVRTIHRLSKI